MGKPNQYLEDPDRWEEMVEDAKWEKDEDPPEPDTEEENDE